MDTTPRHADFSPVPGIYIFVSATPFSHCTEDPQFYEGELHLTIKPFTMTSVHCVFSNPNLMP